MSRSQLFYFGILTIILTMGLILWQWPLFEGMLHSMIETKGLRSVSWSCMDLGQTARNAAEICKKHQTYRVMVDAIGVGAAVPGMVTPPRGARGRREDERAGHREKTEGGEFYRLRDQLWWAVREWLRTDPGPCCHLMKVSSRNCPSPRTRSRAARSKSLPRTSCASCWAAHRTVRMRSA